MESIVETKKLSARLRGQSFCIPNLTISFEHWPSATNQHLDNLRREIDEMLESTISDKKKIRALKACDFAYLTCCLYPHIEWEELQVAGAYMLWIFLWDDEIDDEGTTIAQSENEAKKYCEESLNYARLSLGLDLIEERGHLDKVENLLCPVATMVYFKPVAQAIRQRRRLFRELESYMIWTTKEQVIRETGYVPMPDQYLELRNWTSGIYPVITIFELILKIKLEVSLIESDDMKIIWRETCFLCMLINDIHSARKELACGSVINAVPIFFHANESKGLDGAMATLVENIKLSIDRFDQAVLRLESNFTDKKLPPQEQKYLDTCRTTVTGLLQWSRSTDRYDLPRYMDKGGRCIITL